MDAPVRGSSRGFGIRLAAAAALGAAVAAFNSVPLGKGLPSISFSAPYRRSHGGSKNRNCPRKTKTGRRRAAMRAHSQRINRERS